jgi:hypothetical protein
MVFLVPAQNVRQNHSIYHTTIPQASTARCVTPNLDMFRSRADRLQLCAIPPSKLRNLYGVCFSAIYPGDHQHKGVRINSSMKEMTLANI